MIINWSQTVYVSSHVQVDCKYISAETKVVCVANVKVQINWLDVCLVYDM